MDIELAKKITKLSEEIEGNNEALAFLLRRKDEIDKGDGFVAELEFHMVKNKRTARRWYLHKEEILLVLNNRIALLERTVTALENQLNQATK